MLKKITLSLVAALSLVAMPQASAADYGPYLNVDAGVNIVHDISIFGTEIDMDPGFRIGIAPGMVINDFFAVEFDTGFIYNEPEEGGDEWFGHVPLIAQAIFKYDFEGGLTIFGGPGVGGTASFIEADAGFDSDTDTAFALAWQAQLGLRYQIGDNLAIGGVYKYLGVNDPEFELFGVDFEVENVHNHYFGVQFTLGF